MSARGPAVSLVFTLTQTHTEFPTMILTIAEHDSQSTAVINLDYPTARDMMIAAVDDFIAAAKSI